MLAGCLAPGTQPAPTTLVSPGTRPTAVLTSSPGSPVQGPSAGEKQSTAMSPATPKPTHIQQRGKAPARLKTASSLQQNGDYARAILEYRGIVDAYPGSIEAKEALFHLGETYLLSRDYLQAVQTFETFLKVYPRDHLVASAVFQLATAHSRLGHVEFAIEGYRQYASLQSLTEGYAHLQMAEVYAEAGELSRSIEEYTKALEFELNSSLRLETMEILADAYRDLGVLRKALAFYNSVLEQMAQRGARPVILFRVGETSQALGEEEGFVRAFAEIVDSYPWSYYAPEALERLLQYGIQVDIYQQGLVRRYQGEYEEAIDFFDSYQKDSPDGDKIIQARYHTNMAYARLGQYHRAIEGLEQLGELCPVYPLACDGLWEMGEILEQLSRYDEAAEVYRQLWLRYPQGSRSEESLFREGLIYYKAARYDLALRVWREQLEARPQSGLRARTDFWLGKALALLGEKEEARQHLESAASRDFGDYYGLRAEVLLAGKQSDPPALTGFGEALKLEELERWLASWAGTSVSDVLGPEIEGEQAFRVGEELLAVGFRRRAIQEFQVLLGAFADRPVALYRLALYFREKGLNSLSVTAAARLMRPSPARSLREVPKALQELLYPLYFAHLAVAEAANADIDPFLLLSLVRQESGFEPHAKSVADARGLTQVIPSTAREIARTLGEQSFALEDLYRQNVALEFGAWYLAR